MRNAIRLIATHCHRAALKPKHALAVFCLLLGASASAQVVFTITDVGPNPYHLPTVINARGQVATSGQPCPTCTGIHALLWSQATGLKDLGTLPGGPGFSEAFGLNRYGQVVGFSDDAAGCCVGFLWTPGEGMQDIGALPGAGTAYVDIAIAHGVNDYGQVVGTSGYSGTCCHAFFWSAATGMKDLGDLPGGQFSGASAIDNKGQVVGTALTATGIFHAFIWSAATGMQELGTPLRGYNSSGAAAMNNKEHVVGVSYCFPNATGCKPFHAFLWTKSKGMQDLGDLPSGFGSSAYAVNGFDQVVGYAGPYNAGGIESGPYPFLWAKGTMWNLNSLIPANSGWQLYTATGINDKGQITGWGINSQGVRSFVLTPLRKAK